MKNFPLFAWDRICVRTGRMQCNTVLIANIVNEHLSFNIQNEIIQNQETVRILGVTCDNCLTFEKHILKLCNKASQKISAFARIAGFKENRT